MDEQEDSPSPGRQTKQRPDYRKYTDMGQMEEEWLIMPLETLNFSLANDFTVWIVLDWQPVLLKIMEIQDRRDLCPHLCHHPVNIDPPSGISTTFPKITLL